MTRGSDRRGEGAALLLAGLASAAGAGMHVLGAALASAALAGLAWHFLLAVVPALAAYVQFRTFRISAECAAEDAALALRTGGESLFRGVVRAAPEERRAQAARTLAPLADAVLLAAGALLAWRFFLAAPGATVQPVVAVPFLGVLAAAAYVGGRYLSAVSEREAYAPLAPAAAWLAGGGILAFAAALVCAAGHAAWAGAPGLADRFVPWWFAALAIEKAATLLGRAYGLGGHEPAPGRSRVVDLVGAPAAVCRRAREALAYNFGIAVSGASVRRALLDGVLPFLLLACAVFLLLSCIAWVEPGRAALLERWGSRRGEVMPPGVSLKLPWPIERLRPVDVSTVRVVLAGEARNGGRGQGAGAHGHDAGARLWNTEHGKELHFLTPAWGESSDAKGLLVLAASVQFSVADPAAFAYTAVRPEEVMDALLRRELVHIAASTDPRAFFAPERAVLGRRLAEGIKERAARYGVLVRHTAIEHAHMPVEVGPAFEDLTRLRAVVEADLASAQTERIRLGALARYESEVLAAEAEAEALRAAARGAAAASAARELAPFWNALGAVLRPRMVFETLARAAGARPKLILPEAPGGPAVFEVDTGERRPLRMTSGEER